MFRFSIRELMFLTALVGVCLAWRSDSAARAEAHHTTREHAERLRNSLELAEDDVDMLAEFIRTGRPRVVCGNDPRPEWELARQPIP
jgi:hypothetical protein